MNSDEIWLLQLWSGVFGAGISAVAAAIVAVIVLYFSNKHQTKLSKEALDLQRTLADAAAKEQKKQFKIELEEQRERDRKDRERAAVHEAIMAADEMAVEYDKGFDALDALLHRMRSGIFRWRAESNDIAAAEELSRWPHHISMLGVAAAKSLKPGESRNTPEYTRLVVATEVFISMFPSISQADDEERKWRVAAMRSARERPDMMSDGVTTRTT